LQCSNPVAAVVFHGPGSANLKTCEPRHQRFRASSITTEEEFRRANRSGGDDRGPQGSPARDGTNNRRLPFRPNPTAPADHAEKIEIGQVNMSGLILVQIPKLRFLRITCERVSVAEVQ
jgi:hypothetical protein